MSPKDTRHNHTSPRHFLDIAELSAADLKGMLAHAHALKAAGRRTPDHLRSPACEGAILAMIFERPSTRTRISFDVAMRTLGGEAIVLSSNDLQLGRGESIADTARVLSRYVDAIMIRTGSHEALMELASEATVPVINGLTNLSHPCQVMADLLTLEEHGGPISEHRVAWVGDVNNVAASFVHAAARFGFELRLAAPPELSLDAELVAWGEAEGANVHRTTDAHEAVQGATAVVTDTWVSMGDEDKSRRIALLEPYRVDAALMAKADPKAVFLHCLPAYRGNEVTEEVIDGPQSAVFDEAENRMHAQKAILSWCLGSGGE